MSTHRKRGRPRKNLTSESQYFSTPFYLFQNKRSTFDKNFTCAYGDGHTYNDYDENDKSEDDNKKDEQTTAESDSRQSCETIQQQYQSTRFLQPYKSACDIYNHYKHNIPVYWLDSNNDFFQCPRKPYHEKKIKKIDTPLFEWKMKHVDKKFTYRDDPNTLEEGEWEYRTVTVWYKKYM